MTEVGEYVGWTLDISKGLDGTPTHSDVSGGATVNKWQYESHGAFVHGSSFNLYFSGPIKNNGKEEGGWGVWLNNSATPDVPPKFLFIAPGGHVVANSCNPNVWAAHVGAQWREKNVKESDAIVFGDTSGHYDVLCYTYSDVRGGISTDRKTQVKAWTGMNNNDARPYSSIPRPLLSRDGTKVMFHSSMLDPLDSWAGMYVAAIRRPEAPRNLKLANGNGKGVQLEWTAASNAHEIKGYHVYRGDRDGHNVTELTDRAIKETSFTDASAQDGQANVYAVTAEEWSTLESDVTSDALRISVENGKASAEPVAALKGWDTTPPATPHGFAVAKDSDEPGQFRLSWQANAEKDLRYYNIYSSAKSQPEAIQKRRIVSPSANQTTYLDWTAPVDSDVYYAITAVDRQGNESAPAYADLKK